MMKYTFAFFALFIIVASFYYDLTHTGMICRNQPEFPLNPHSYLKKTVQS